ncbi:MAG TPA: hypothetical protein VGO06_28465 [Bosea sp. (in: a-proteobacteria)]|jgi:hypothetical protein|uniref:hypothetical protein n=1 Tax=Bosea sp. (in: a-proteobacteria) TaxID=1871050 RepID=UPI002E15E6F7|nr:hypothetical protein [Bosea sp. (in: a-proteobacteria)]
MSSPILARIAKLEERRRPGVDRRTKAEIDAMVKAILSDPEQVAAMWAELLGTAIEEERPHAAALMAALRADT